MINASLFRSFRMYRESQFQIRFEAFNRLKPRAPQQSEYDRRRGTFGYITSFGTTSPLAPRVLQFAGYFKF